FAPHHGLTPTPANVLGILSLVLWSLLLVIVLKYLTFIMQADNRGEGGILALMALLGPAAGRTPALISLGLFGAALLYGDGVITPAISVLSAIEGLEVATPRLADYVMPVTVLILLALFLVQRRGTTGIGAVFGPSTIVWFLSIAAVGTPRIAAQPGVLAAAAVVASQALISGAFSLTQQAVQLGFVPRVKIVHTSATTEGQIYIPVVNGLLTVACVALVLVAGNSSNLASAYGIAVTGTMSITSVLFYAVARRCWC